VQLKQSQEIWNLFLQRGARESTEARDEREVLDRREVVETMAEASAGDEMTILLAARLHRSGTRQPNIRRSHFQRQIL
jgi:hypothetical protein